MGGEEKLLPKAAHCERQVHDGYKIVVCDDKPVMDYCAKIVKVDDQGRKLSYHPRACTRFKGWPETKPTILMARSYLACWSHEVAHVEHPFESAMVEKKFPCFGEKK